MAVFDELPSFSAEYEPRKLNQLVATLERFFRRDNNQPRRQSAVTAATYNCLPTDETLLVDRTATGACTINLPTALLFQGRALTVWDLGNSAGSNNITVDAAGSDTINGSGTHVISTNRQAVTYQSDGSNWFILSVAP